LTIKNILLQNFSTFHSIKISLFALATFFNNENGIFYCLFLIIGVKKFNDYTQNGFDLFLLINNINFKG